MKTDLYTKAILTIIALTLVCLVFQNFQVITPAQASNQPHTTFSSETNKINQTLDVRIVGHSIPSYDPIPVTIK